MIINDRKDNIDLLIEELENTNDGKKFKIGIAIPMGYGWIDPVNFVIEEGFNTYYYKLNYIKSDNGKAYFEADVFLETKALYRYYFQAVINGQTRYIKKENVVIQDYFEYMENGERKLRKEEKIIDDRSILQDEMWKMSVNFETPEWTQGAFMYHFFVDRFKRGNPEPMKEMPRRHIHKSWDEEVVIGPDENGIWNNDFFGGDLKGIIEKLDYIASLGINIIFLSPVVFAQSTHRYDAADYEMIDPYAGCKEDLKLLCDEAHKRGMKVVLDAVFDHTGCDSKYFNKYRNPEWEKEYGIGAYYSDDAKFADFYSKGYDKDTNKWDFQYWWGDHILPKCNCYSESWKEYITGKGRIIDQWFDLGIDGLRLDVADELSDEFIELIRKAVKRNKPDGFILGEVWENPMTKDNRDYMRSGKGMDSVMNYNFIESLMRYFRYGDVTDLALKIREIRNLYPDDSIFSSMNFTSTHDITRLINFWISDLFGGPHPWDLKNNNAEFCKNFKLSKEEYEQSKEILMAYIFCITFMPGILSIFYGDEVGAQGLGNLLNRVPFPWGKEDKELLDFFRMLGQIRKEETFMRRADLKICDINFNYVAFERINGNDKAFVIVNRTSTEQYFIVPEEYRSSEKVYSLRKSKKDLLTPYGAIAIKK